jgi:hypothetical protein
MCGCAQDADPPVRVLDHRERLQPGSGQGDGLEEVAPEKRVGLGPHEVRHPPPGFHPPEAPREPRHEVIERI